jgi:predicted transposase YbfD/YdcC
MDASTAAPVLRLMDDVIDPRRHNTLHPLPQLLVMALIAVLCGCDSWEDVAEHCEEREEWFRTFLDLPHGIPSHDTFGRVFARLDPLQLEAALRRWMETLGQASAGRLIAIDGKSLRRSFEHSWDKSGMTHLVSAFASENKVALAQLGVLDKENEIVAIPKLLAMLDLRGATVTIDAIGCQREIARQITDAGGHFVLQVKENQQTLYEHVKSFMDGAILDRLATWKGSCSEDTDGGHGRIEVRKVWVTTDVRHLSEELRELWPDVKALAAVERSREVIGLSNQGPSTERHYFVLSNGRCKAQGAGRIIRGHWSIENTLHYVLDVSFNEDQSRVRKGHGAENFSRLRRLTANLLQLNKIKKSIKLQRKKCCWSEKFLFDTLLRGLNPPKS